MLHRSSVGAIALAVLMTFDLAPAFDETKHPDWKGQWTRAPVSGLTGQPSFYPNKSNGLVSLTAR